MSLRKMLDDVWDWENHATESELREWLSLDQEIRFMEFQLLRSQAKRDQIEYQVRQRIMK